MVDQVKEEAQIAIQKIWPGWEVIDFIGEGAFGKVYKIERKEFGYTYNSALKIIRIPQNDSELMMVMNHGLDEKSTESYFRGVVEDVVKEFALMAQLKRNSNIVSYEDHVVVPIEGQIGWNIYIRMELLTPLYTAIRKTGFEKTEVIRVGIDIARAIELCHSRNIIHRDIKPANIFRSSVGDYKLGDFGIAKQVEKSKSEMSKKGTSSYMAPEVYRFENYDTTVDIYSLGILLYRFLNNNRLPFLPIDKPVKFNDMEAANLKRFSGAEIPKPVDAQGRLGDIVLKACAFDAKDRYQHAEDLRRDLERELECEIAAQQIANLYDFIEPTMDDMGEDIDDLWGFPPVPQIENDDSLADEDLDATKGLGDSLNQRASGNDGKEPNSGGDSNYGNNPFDETRSDLDYDFSFSPSGNSSVPTKDSNTGMIIVGIGIILLILGLALYLGV